MKRLLAGALVLVLCLCLLAPEKSVPSQIPPPEPEISAAPVPSGRAPAPSSASSKPPPPPSSSSQPEPGELSQAEAEKPPVEDDMEARFPPAGEKDQRDETTKRLEEFLEGARLGTFVADINNGSKGEFSSIEELDKGVLLACGIFSHWQDWSKEAVEEQVRFYFGEKAVVDHYAQNGLLYGWEYDEKTENHIPPGRDYLSFSCPWILSWQKERDEYAVIFTAYAVAPGRVVSPDHEVDFDSWEEAKDWYKEHGAQAKAILREREDGSLIFQSLEVLRGCDPWEQ